MKLQTTAMLIVAAFALGTILGVKYEGNRRDSLDLAQERENEAERETRRELVFNDEIDRLREDTERTLSFGESLNAGPRADDDDLLWDAERVLRLYGNR